VQIMELLIMQFCSLLALTTLNFAKTSHKRQCCIYFFAVVSWNIVGEPHA
jgi:hypothetical protein